MTRLKCPTCRKRIPPATFVCAECGVTFSKNSRPKSEPPLITFRGYLVALVVATFLIPIFKVGGDKMPARKIAATEVTLDQNKPADTGAGAAIDSDLLMDATSQKMSDDSPPAQHTPTATGLGAFKVTDVHQAYNRKARELGFDFEASLDHCLTPERKSGCTYHLGEFSQILAMGDPQTYELNDFTIGSAPQGQVQSAEMLLMWTAAMALFAPETAPREKLDAIKQLLDGVERSGDGHSQIGTVRLRLQKLEGMGIWFHVLPAKTPID